MDISRLFVVLLAFVFVPSLVAQSCPTYTKNRDSVAVFPLGAQASLPEGFAVYRLNGSPGLFRTPLQTYDPAIVPGTEQDVPFNITISDDGRWVLYADSVQENFIVQRLDGTGRATMWNQGSKVCGFYRNSPFGTEFYYLGSGQSPRTIHAMQLDLSGATASFVSSSLRTILEFGWGERHLENSWVSASSAVVGDQILCREDAFINGYFGRTAFITIPDSGRGTAGVQDIRSWVDDPFETVWGCGHAMSHDGVHCLANASLIGRACAESGNSPLCSGTDSSVYGSSCIPNRRSVLVHGEGWTADTQHFDHKGFYVTRFWRNSDQPTTLDAIIDTFATSINWAPPEYRRGEYTDVDFTSWNFSNNPRIVIGALKGIRLRDYNLPNALWVIDWIDNIWTRITPDTMTLFVDDPAMFITDSSSVKPAANARSRAALSGARSYLVISSSRSPNFPPAAVYPARTMYGITGKKVSARAVVRPGAYLVDIRRD